MKYKQTESKGKSRRTMTYKGRTYTIEVGPLSYSGIETYSEAGPYTEYLHANGLVRILDLTKLKEKGLAGFFSRLIDGVGCTLPLLEASGIVWNAGRWPGLEPDVMTQIRRQVVESKKLGRLDNEEFYQGIWDSIHDSARHNYPESVGKVK